MWVPLGLALGAGYMLTRPSMNSRRISWQEFRVNYLEKGEVDRLEVVNKDVVKVYLRRDAGSGPGVSWDTLIAIQLGLVVVCIFQFFSYPHILCLPASITHMHRLCPTLPSTLVVLTHLSAAWSRLN